MYRGEKNFADHSAGDAPDLYLRQQATYIHVIGFEPEVYPGVLRLRVGDKIHHHASTDEDEMERIDFQQTILEVQLRLGLVLSYSSDAWHWSRVVRRCAA